MAFVVNEVVTNFVANLDGFFDQLDALTGKLETLSKKTFRVRFEADSSLLGRQLRDINANLSTVATAVRSVQSLITSGIQQVTGRVQTARDSFVRGVQTASSTAGKQAKQAEFTAIDAVENFAKQSVDAFLRVGSTITFLAFTIVPNWVKEMTVASDATGSAFERMFRSVVTTWAPVFGIVTAGWFDVADAGVKASNTLAAAQGIVPKAAEGAAVATVTIWSQLGAHVDFMLKKVSEGTTYILTAIGTLLGTVGTELGRALETVLNVAGQAVSNFAGNILEATQIIFTFGLGVKEATQPLGQLALSLGVFGQMSLALVGFNVITGSIINRIRGFISGVQPNTVLGKAAVLIEAIFDGLVRMATPAAFIVNRFAAAAGFISLTAGLLINLASGVSFVGTAVFTVIGALSVIRPLVTNLYRAVQVRFLQLRAALGDGRAQFALLLRGVREGFNLFARFGREVAKLGRNFSLLGAIRKAFDVLKSIRDVLVRIADIVTFGALGLDHINNNAARLLSTTHALSAEMSEAGKKAQKARQDFDEGSKLGERALFGMINATKTVANLIPQFALNLTTVLGVGVLNILKNTVVGGFRKALDGIFGAGTLDKIKFWFQGTFDWIRKGFQASVLTAIGRSFFSLFTTKTRDLGKKLKDIWAPNQARKAGAIYKKNQEELERLQKRRDDANKGYEVENRLLEKRLEQLRTHVKAGKEEVERRKAALAQAQEERKVKAQAFREEFGAERTLTAEHDKRKKQLQDELRAANEIVRQHAAKKNVLNAQAERYANIVHDLKAEEVAVGRLNTAQQGQLANAIRHRNELVKRRSVALAELDTAHEKVRALHIERTLNDKALQKQQQKAQAARDEFREATQSQAAAQRALESAKEALTIRRRSVLLNKEAVAAERKKLIEQSAARKKAISDEIDGYRNRERGLKLQQRRQLEAIAKRTSAKHDEFVGDEKAVAELRRLRQAAEKTREKDIKRILHIQDSVSEQGKQAVVEDAQQMRATTVREYKLMETALKTVLGRENIERHLGAHGGPRRLAKVLLGGDAAEIVEYMGRDVRTIRKFVSSQVKAMEREVGGEFRRLNKTLQSRALAIATDTLVEFRRSLPRVSTEIRNLVKRNLDEIRAVTGRRLAGKVPTDKPAQEFAMGLASRIAGGLEKSKLDARVAEWLREVFGKDTFKHFGKSAQKAMIDEIILLVEEGAAPFLKPGSDPKHPRGLRLISWLTTLGRMASTKFGETMRQELGKNVSQVTRKQGAEVGRMIQQGLQDGQPAVMKGMHDVANIVKGHLPASPPILGPLKGDFLFKAGGRIVQMMSLGILSNQGLLAQVVGRTLQFAFAPLFGPAGLLISGVVKATKAIFNLRFAFQSLAQNELLRGLTETAEQMSQIGRQATRSVGRENIAQFDAFRLAMEQQKVEATQLETVFQQLNRRVAEASEGNIEAAAFFERFGVNIQDLNDGTISLIDVFFKLQDAYQANANNSKLQQEILDATGATMLDMRSAFVKGSADIKKAMKEARESSLVWTDSDIRRAEDFEKAWIRVKQVVGVITWNLQNEFFPAASGFFDRALQFWNTYHTQIVSGLNAVSKLVVAVFNILFEKFGQWMRQPAKFFDHLLVLWQFTLKTAFSIASAFWNNFATIGQAAFGAMLSIIWPFLQAAGQIILKQVLPYVGTAALRPFVEFFDNIPATFIGIFEWFANLFGNTWSRIWLNLKIWWLSTEKALMLIKADFWELFDHDRAERERNAARRGRSRAIDDAKKELDRAIQQQGIAIDFYINRRLRDTENLTAQFFNDWERQIANQAAEINKALSGSLDGVGDEVIKKMTVLGDALSDAVGEAAPGIREAFAEMVTGLEISPDNIQAVNDALDQLRQAAIDAGVLSDMYDPSLFAVPAEDAISEYEFLNETIESTTETVNRFGALSIQNLRDSTEAASQYRGALGSIRDLSKQMLDLALENAEDQSLFDKMFGDVDVQSLKLEKLELELAGRIEDIKQRFAETTVEVRERIFDLNEQIIRARESGDLGLLAILEARLQVLMAAEQNLASQQTAIIDQIKEQTEKAREKIKLEPFEGLGETVGGAISEGLNTALKDALEGKKVQLKTVVGGVFRTIRDELGKQFIESTVNSLQKSMTKMFSEVFSFAGDLAGDLANGVLFVVSSLLATSEEEINAVQEQIDTMVESTEKVRGIISGETTVKLKEVQDNLRDAMIPTNRILEGIRADLARGRGTLAAEAGGTSTI